MPKNEHFLMSSYAFRCLILSLLLLLMPSAHDAWSAQEQSSTNATPKAMETMPDWIKPPAFQYTSRGKPDPFRSFVQPETPQADEEQKDSKPKRPLTPLERIQPTQLNLVGILTNGGQKAQAMALVELPDGKGYVLRSGTRIGRNDGKVVSIGPGRVTIQERVTNIFGEKKTNKVVLKLHKAAGESND
jgi:type IV pilus assembly protein PilP